MTLDQFLDKFRKAVRHPRYMRRINTGGKVAIRATSVGADGGLCFCPITLVAHNEGLGYFSPSSYKQAAELIGLPLDLAGRVVEAADSKVCFNPATRTLRRRFRDAFRFNR